MDEITQQGICRTTALILPSVITYIMDISVKQMYDIENAGHAMGFHKRFMMENAGAAAVRRLMDKHAVASKRILVMAGPGNNGGDGLVMARHLVGHGAHVTVVIPTGPDSIKTSECRDNYTLLEKMPSVRIADSPGDTKYDIIVDALLGTGITGDIREPLASAILYTNSSDAYTLAVDVPSGLDPDTGRTANQYVVADMTVTFHRMKRGIPLNQMVTGRVYAEPIGIPPEAEVGII